MISICRRRLLPDGSTTCRQRSLEPSLVYVCLCFCMSEVISSFRSLRVFALLMLFICLILHTMWSGKSLQLMCILSFGILCLSDVCENYIGSVYVGGYCRLSESGPCVFGKLCPVGFLVVCKSLSVLL